MKSLESARGGQVLISGDCLPLRKAVIHKAAVETARHLTTMGSYLQ